MSVDRSKYTKTSIKSVPHQKRAISMDMRGRDWYGKWFRCWNCGMINNSDRAQVAAVYQGGDRTKVFEQDDINYGAFYDSTEYTVFPYENFAKGQYITLDLQSINLMQLDANGKVITPHITASVVITGGCAFCGSMNYR
jgi:hypothetical protein